MCAAAVYESCASLFAIWRARARERKKYGIFIRSNYDLKSLAL